MKTILMITIVSLFLSNAFSQENTKLTLKDLSILSSRVPDDQFNDEFAQARVKRLHHHKKLGHMTMGLMLLTGASSLIALKNPHDNAKLDLHFGLAAAAMASYYTAAYFALSAPRPMSLEDESKRLWHKRMAWIHGPAMILAPVLGYLAYNDYKNDRDPHGAAKLYRPVMWTGIGALAGAFGLMTFKF